MQRRKWLLSLKGSQDPSPLRGPIYPGLQPCSLERGCVLRCISSPRSALREPGVWSPRLPGVGWGLTCSLQLSDWGLASQEGSGSGVPGRTLRPLAIGSAMQGLERTLLVFMCVLGTPGKTGVQGLRDAGERGSREHGWHPVPTTRPLTFAHQQAEKLGKAVWEGEAWGRDPLPSRWEGGWSSWRPCPAGPLGCTCSVLGWGPLPSWLVQGGSRSGHCLVLAPPP